MSVNHQHLRAFHAVATDLSFSRAARRLNISQPTLSQQIKALEHRHGRMLFEGRRRPLHLTAIGRKLLALTGRMFATSDEIADLLGDSPVADPVSIRIASDSPPYAALLARALLAADPRRGVEVRVVDADAALSRLLEAHADVVIARDPQIDARFAYQPLFVDELRVVVPATHRLAAGGTFPLAALAQECLLMRETTSKTRGAADALLAAHDLRPARTIELHSREAIHEAVAIGMGVGLFFSAECPPDPRVVALPADLQPDIALLTGYVVCHADQQRSAAIRAVLEAAARIDRQTSGRDDG